MRVNEIHCRNAKILQMRMRFPLDNVIWINGSSKEDNRIFDSEIEAREWVDSLYSEFATYNHLKVDVYTEKINIGGQIIYKIWTVNV